MSCEWILILPPLDLSQLFERMEFLGLQWDIFFLAKKYFFFAPIGSAARTSGTGVLEVMAVVMAAGNLATEPRRIRRHYARRYVGAILGAAV